MKIALKLLILFLSVSLIPLSVVSYAQFTTAEKEIIKQIFSRLSTTSLLIESQVNSEIEKDLLVLDLFSSRVLLRDSLEHFNQHGDEESQKNVQNIISKAFLSNSQIDAIHIFNDNKLVAFVDEHLLSENDLHTNFDLKNYPFKEFDFITKNTGVDHSIHLRLIGYLFNDDNQKIGTIILDFNPGPIFLGTQELGIGNSGEYIIAKKNVNGDAVLITSIPPGDNVEFNIVSKERLDIPIIQALLKNEKTFVTLVDYDEKPVFAITKYLEPYDLGLVIKIDKTEALSSIEHLRIFTLILSTITFVLATITAIFFSKSVSDPITKIRKATKEIVSGEFTKKLNVNGSSEIKELSKDINDMAHELDAQKKSLVNSERLSAIGELAGRFSHDIRNPLSNIQMAIDLLQKNKDISSISPVKEKFEIITKNLDRISHQVDDVLDFVRTTPLEKKVIDPLSCLSESVTSMDIPKNIKINFPNECNLLYGDSYHLQIVCKNLILNAIQAIGNEGGSIDVRFKDEPQYNVIEFEDSGPGFPEKQLSTIFEALTTSKQKGTGLGLASCKNIVEQHGGTITAKNNPTTFTIRLPKR